jgi:hypothetical protein
MAEEKTEKDETTWLDLKIKHIEGLKSPSDQQKLLLLLSKQSQLSEDEQKTFDAIVNAEKASERARSARSKVTKLLNADKKKARKARNHEMMEAAGLMSLAGLIDKQTAIPILEKSVLLGALAAISEMEKTDPRISDFRSAGDRLLNNE